MPKMSKSYNLNDLILNRTIGVEMEGYVSGIYPRDMELDYIEPVKTDGSLRYQSWSEDNPRNGVEIATIPLRDLSKLETLFTQMETYNWDVNYDENAGTHVHVDVSDFTAFDKIRLLWFGKQIEDIMFMFVKKYRREEGWCRKLDRIYTKDAMMQDEEFWNSRTLDDYDDMEFKYTDNEYYYLDSDKYLWMNMFATDYPTVEFRIFHAIENKEELVRFAYLVHNMVETVKNSTVEQLGFIIQSLRCLNDAREVGDAFCRALGLNFRLPLRSKSAQRILEKEWNLPAYQQRQAERKAKREQQAV